MDEELTPRPEVLAFAQAIERRLRKHDHDWGNSWKEVPTGPLMLDLYLKVAKLHDALITHNKERILSAAGSVGAHAMFVADVAGNLSYEPPEAPPTKG